MGSAFSKFGKVDATSEPVSSIAPSSFLELLSVQDGSRRAIVDKLLRLPGATQAASLRKVVAMIQAHNPFAVVVSEIDKIIALMSKEEEDDNSKLRWCTNARNTNTEETQKTKDNIDHLETAIDGLESDIASVKEIIATSKVNIQELTELMTQTKAVRQSEHAEFEENIKETQDVMELLGVAIQILSESREAAGESSLGNAISLLQTLHTNTASEEETLKANEQTAVDSFDSFMSARRADLAASKKQLDEGKVSLAAKQASLKVAREELSSNQDTLASLKQEFADFDPGCVFIETNIEQRNAHRATEKKSLTEAKQLMMDTPVFKEAAEKSHNESLGECLSVCSASETNVRCKACLSEVTVLGYCTSHPATEGC